MNPDDGTEAECTNPAALAGGRAPLTSRFPADAAASILTALGTDASGTSWIDTTAGEVTTPYAVLPAIVTGGCVSWNGYHWLEIEPNADAGPRADDIAGELTPEWGMHLVDINVVMGDLQHLVASQGEACLATGAG